MDWDDFEGKIARHVWTRPLGTHINCTCLLQPCFWSSNSVHPPTPIRRVSCCLNTKQCSALDCLGTNAIKVSRKPEEKPKLFLMDPETKCDDRQCSEKKQQLWFITFARLLNASSCLDKKAANVASNFCLCRQKSNGIFFRLNQIT